MASGETEGEEKATVDHVAKNVKAEPVAYARGGMCVWPRRGGETQNMRDDEALKWQRELVLVQTMIMIDTPSEGGVL